MTTAYNVAKWRHNSTSCRAASRDCVAGAEPDHDRSVQEVCPRLAHCQWRGLSQPPSIAHSLIDPCSPRGPQPLYSQYLLGPRDPIARYPSRYPRYPPSRTHAEATKGRRTSAVSQWATERAAVCAQRGRCKSCGRCVFTAQQRAQVTHVPKCTSQLLLRHVKSCCTPYAHACHAMRITAAESEAMRFGQGTTQRRLQQQRPI